MGIFNATMKGAKRAMIGGAVGGGVSAFSSGYDKEAAMGGFWAGAAAGVVGGGIASKMFAKPNAAVVSGMQKVGGGMARAGASMRRSSRTMRSPFGNMVRGAGTGIGNVGLGVYGGSIKANKATNAAFLALGTGAAGYIGGSIMESNRGNRRITRNRNSRYGY